MAAVLKLDDDQVERLCAQRDDVWPANYNCPGQVVVSGSDEGLDAMAVAVSDAGGKQIRLKVAGAFHCPLMAGAAARFAPAVRRGRIRGALDRIHEHRHQRPRDPPTGSRRCWWIS